MDFLGKRCPLTRSSCDPRCAWLVTLKKKESDYQVCPIPMLANNTNSGADYLFIEPCFKNIKDDEENNG